MHLLEGKHQWRAGGVSPEEGNSQVADGPMEAAVVYQAGGRDGGQLSSHRQAHVCSGTCKQHTLIEGLLAVLG